MTGKISEVIEALCWFMFWLNFFFGVMCLGLFFSGSVDILEPIKNFAVAGFLWWALTFTKKRE